MQLEKACTQQQRPNTAKNKWINNNKQRMYTLKIIKVGELWEEPVQSDISKL